jgi:hypothetical protein
VPRYVVTEFREGARFRIAYDRLVRIGPPFMEVILRVRIAQIREELTIHSAVPPDATPHPDLDGSYVIEREGLRVRYYVTRAAPAGWLAGYSAGESRRQMLYRFVCVCRRLTGRMPND